MSQKDLSILTGTLITSILLLSWILSGYAAEKKSVNETFYDDSSDYARMAEKILSKRIRNATSITINESINQTNTNKTRNETIYGPYIECRVNADCGMNGTIVTNDFKCYEGDVYRQYIQFRCEKPNTTAARCVGTERTQFIHACGRDEECVEGDSYCAYRANVPYMSMTWKRPGSTYIYVTKQQTATYNGYRFKAVYVFSENSKDKGLTVDVLKPDGGEEWIYIHYEKDVKLDNLIIGLLDIEKTDKETIANIWIYETD